MFQYSPTKLQLSVPVVEQQQKVSSLKKQRCPLSEAALVLLVSSSRANPFSSRFPGPKHAQPLLVSGAKTLGTYSKQDPKLKEAPHQRVFPGTCSLLHCESKGEPRPAQSSRVASGERLVSHV